MNTLNEALTFVSEKYKETETEYPELRGLSDAEKIKFSIRHCVLHSAKITGKLAAISEGTDHGSPIDMEKVRGFAVKEMINALTLASRIGLSGDELLNRIPQGSLTVPKNSKVA
jgi:hypothetical protein